MELFAVGFVVLFSLAYVIDGSLSSIRDELRGIRKELLRANERERRRT